MDELIRKQDALNAFCLDNRMFLPRNSGRTGTYIKMVMDNIKNLPAVQPKAYTKADYIMALHKEYGCTLTRAEEAHDKALEYLRSKAIVKG